MAQPAQLFTPGDPSNGYVVIDNSASPVTITANGSPQTSNNWSPTFAKMDDIYTPGGANSQDKNAFGNGTIPDAVNRSKSFTTSAAVCFQIVKYLNPA